MSISNRANSRFAIKEYLLRKGFLYILCRDKILFKKLITISINIASSIFIIDTAMPKY